MGDHMGEIIGKAVGLFIDAVEAALERRKDINEALAESLEEMAAKLRSGELKVDAALGRAKQDQQTLKNLRDKFR